MNPQPPTIVTIVENLDVTVAGCSLPVEICSMWWGRMQLELDSAVGSPKVTLEAAIEGTNFAPQEECSELTLTQALTQARVGFVDGLKYRICVDPNGATAGTLTAKMLLKKI